MKLVYLAGTEKSGITSLLRSMLDTKKFGRTGVIAHNIQSGMELEGHCDVVESYSIKPCCARPRMLEFRMERMLEKTEVDTIFTEPPGMSKETAAPILNRLYALRKEITIAPLTTVVDGRNILDKGVDKNNLDGLSLFNQINESDIIVIHKSDLFSPEEREKIRSQISGINDECEIVFTSSETGKNIDALTDLLLGKAYHRPLVY